MKEFILPSTEYKKEKNKNRVNLDIEELKVHDKRSVKLTSCKDDKKYGSDVSNEVIVKISNRFDPLSDDDKDITDNDFSDIVIEKSIDKEKEKVKKKNKILKRYNKTKTKTIMCKELRQGCKKSFKKKKEKDMISI